MSSSAEGTAWLMAEEKGNKAVACGDGLPTLNPSMCLFEHHRAREAGWFVAHPR